MKHSASLILVWRVAEFEARHAKASTIEPNHLLLGLCKVVDLDRAAGLDAKTFRRKLRRVSAERRFVLDDSERLRRSVAAKQIFAEAEHFAQLGSSALYPVHLLYAGLLADDEHRDATLAELNVEKKRLLNISKREVLGRQMGSASPSAKARTRWN